MKYIFITIFVVFNLNASPQNFSSVYEGMKNDDRFSKMLKLQNFQSLNPDHALTYMLLAEIYDQYMRETSPIYMYDFLLSNYRQVETYLSLVPAKIDERQVRLENDYFSEIGVVKDKRRVNISEVLDEVEKRKVSAHKYFNHAKGVHDNYMKFINKYNNCLFKYRDILQKYPDYKELFLLAGNDLIKEIAQMAIDFDSSLVYFNAYRQSSEHLQHILKINNYTLKPISTYRLEGLVESDFTANIVELWDYKTWANHFIELFNSDIKEIRQGLIAVNQAIDKQTKELKATTA
jgi:hypothetical protein